MLVLVPVLMSSANAEDGNDWKAKPGMTEAYEQESGKIYLEWNGSAPFYQVYLDGKQVMSVDVPSALIDMQKGAHTVKIVPAYKKDGSAIDVGLSALGQLGLDVGFSVSETATGMPSEPFPIDYIPDPLYNTELTEPTASMSPDDSILLSLFDNYGSDEYLVTVKSGNDINHVRYFLNDAAPNEYVSVNGSKVTIRLDPVYLKENGCMQPVIGNKYSFTVQFRKYAISMLSGEKIVSVIHESKESKELNFTPIAAWSVAPIITMAEQTGEGQVTLQWTHDSGEKNACEYAIVLANKVLGVKATEMIVATTSDNEVVLQDLADGDYSYSIIPSFENKQGTASDEVNITIKNTWNEAPKLTLSQLSDNQVKLEWKASQRVEVYHFRVYVGDSKSILQYVGMDYKEHKQFDIPVDGDVMNTTFTYNGEVDPENGVKLKFEIWGTKRTDDGTEQVTQTGSETITLS